jgi:hypothetical protein
LAKELKENMKMMYHQPKSFNKEKQIIKTNKIKILKLKSTASEITNQLKNKKKGARQKKTHPT